MITGNEKLDRALFENDRNVLEYEFGCRCCCEEHTFRDCKARQWGGCRGQWSDEPDEESWFRFYQASRWFTLEQWTGKVQDCDARL